VVEVDVLVERCAGRDVHKDTVVAAVRLPGDAGEEGRVTVVRTFGTFTAELLELRDWLIAQGVTLVGMESTGVFWKPVYHLLEDAVECWVVNAQHVHNVPGPARRMSRTRCGWPSSSSTAWFEPVSCRRHRSVSCAR
jgi:transposase